MWGAQLMGGRGTGGNSSYTVDGSQSPNNTIFLPSINPVLPTILFRTSGLGMDSHTLKFTNGGVHLYIAHFKVQDIETVTPTMTITPVQPQSAQSTSGTTDTTVGPTESAGSHFILEEFHCILTAIQRVHHKLLVHMVTLLLPPPP